ncbi:hypothetical protein, partial [Burkholderia ubonensis]|uniref:hypothetical protein n=1 Tax=Burkholderia ubonensis TaxID=101571 RepID=UPI001C42FAD9
AQVDHRIKAASEEIVGHVGALQLPGFESDRYDFWEFTQRSAPGDPLRCLALLRFAWPTNNYGAPPQCAMNLVRQGYFDPNERQKRWRR